MLFGAPGYKDFMGSIIRRDINNLKDGGEEKLTLRLLHNFDNTLKENSYLGYSLTTGFFDANKNKYVVMSTPKNGTYNGKVAS